MCYCDDLMHQSRFYQEEYMWHEHLMEAAGYPHNCIDYEEWDYYSAPLYSFFDAAEEQRQFEQFQSIHEPEVYWYGNVHNC